MEKQFLKDLTDAGVVKVNFEKKDLSIRRMKCTTNSDYLKEHADKTGWKEDDGDKESAPTILPVWDIEVEGWRNIPIAKVLFILVNSKVKYTRFFQIVRELDSSKFIAPTKKPSMGNISDQAQILHGNLWGMFNTRFTPEQLKEFRAENKGEPFGCNVSDYGWTDEVEKEFYDHEANKPIVKFIKKLGGWDWGIFVLDAEPSNIDHFTDSPLIEEGFPS